MSEEQNNIDQASLEQIEKLETEMNNFIEKLASAGFYTLSHQPRRNINREKRERRFYESDIENIDDYLTVLKKIFIEYWSTHFSPMIQELAKLDNNQQLNSARLTANRLIPEFLYSKPEYIKISQEQQMNLLAGLQSIKNDTNARNVLRHYIETTPFIRDGGEAEDAFYNTWYTRNTPQKVDETKRKYDDTFFFNKIQLALESLDTVPWNEMIGTQMGPGNNSLTKDYIRLQLGKDFPDEGYAVKFVKQPVIQENYQTVVCGIHGVHDKLSIYRMGTDVLIDQAFDEYGTPFDLEHIPETVVIEQQHEDGTVEPYQLSIVKTKDHDSFLLMHNDRLIESINKNYTINPHYILGETGLVLVKSTNNTGDISDAICDHEQFYTAFINDEGERTTWWKIGTYNTANQQLEVILSNKKSKWISLDQIVRE